MVNVTAILMGVWVAFCATETWMVAFPEFPVSMEGITETSIRVGVPADAGEIDIHGGAALPDVPESMVVV